MASSNVCFQCKKEPGVCTCAGCNEFFCEAHFTDHRRLIKEGLNELEDIYNIFLQKLKDREQPKRAQAALLSQIQQWENRTVERVRQSARAVSDEVQQLFDRKLKAVEGKLQETTIKLQQCRKVANFVEKDLDEIRNTFDRLQRTYDQITQPSTVKVCEERSQQIVWDTLIYAVDESTVTQAARKCFDRFQESTFSSDPRVLVHLCVG
jgi:seryl-tRNA synthetase